MLSPGPDRSVWSMILGSPRIDSRAAERGSLAQRQAERVYPEAALAASDAQVCSRPPPGSGPWHSSGFTSATAHLCSPLPTGWLYRRRGGGLGGRGEGLIVSDTTAFFDLALSLNESNFSTNYV